MIGNLAQKRTNLVALATLLALVAAMFALLGTASAAAPAAPADPVVNDGSGYDDATDDFVLSWTAAVVAAGDDAVSDYDVQYRKQGSGNWMDHTADAGAAPADSTDVSRSFVVADTDTDDALTRFTSYEFRVRAENTDGESAWSDVLTTQIGQDEDLGDCSTSQTLRLDADTAVDTDTAAEMCSIELAGSKFGSSGLVLTYEVTSGTASQLTFGGTAEANSAVLDVTAGTAATTDSVVVEVSYKLTDEPREIVGTYTFRSLAYGEEASPMTTTTAAAGTAQVGDVSATYGFCSASEVLVTAQGGSTKVTVVGPDGDDDGSALDLLDISCSEDDLHKPFNIAPNGTTEPTVTGAEPSALLLLGDDDGVVAGGTDLAVHGLFLNWETAASVANVDMTSDSGLVIDWVRVSGVFTGDRNDDDRTVDFVSLAGLSLDYPEQGRAFELNIHTVTIPEGTPAGEYTISARLIWDTDDAGDEKGMTGTTDNDDEIMVVTRTFTVGDAGEAVGSVDLALGNQKEDNPLTTLVETKAETGTAPADGGDIWLKASVKTSLGGPTNKADIKSITFIAPGAKLTVYDDGTFSGGKLVDSNGKLRDAGGGAAAPDELDSGTNSVQITGSSVENAVWVKVEKDDEEPGEVAIYALVVGDGSSDNSETVNLTFSGSGTILVLGDAAAAAVGEQTEFSVVAEDPNGNETTINQLAFTVADADGKAVSGTHVKVTQGNTGDSTERTNDDDPNEIAGIVTIGPKAEPGVYTITVALAGVAASATTTDITVTGRAANVELEASATEVELNDIVTVTATVTDESGEHVADGTAITWGTFGKLLLTLVGGAEETKDGQAKALFGVSSGSGGAQITAIAGDGVGSVAVTSADAAAEEEATVSCLSNLNGFATWSCGVETSASDIFGLVSGRGATAIHLWNGSSWIRYSVVDGTMVPGSSDFMVAENDILYISN